MNASFKKVLRKHTAKIIAFVVSCTVFSLIALSVAFAAPELIKVNERITELKENIEETQKFEEEKEEKEIFKAPSVDHSYCMAEEPTTSEETTAEEITETETLIEEPQTEVLIEEAATQSETEIQTEVQTEAATESQTETEKEPEPTTQQKKPEIKVEITSPTTQLQEEIMSNVEKEVLRLLNKERAANGIKPLIASNSLQRAAQIRVREIFTKFSHTRPNGHDCYSAFPNGCSWKGENIAMGHKSPEQVMNGWMNSQGHRANILNSKFTHVGIGALCIDGKWGWVQCFGQFN